VLNILRRHDTNKFHRTYGDSKSRKYGRHNPITEELKRTICNEYSAGNSAYFIATTYGVSDRTILRVLEDGGIIRRHNRQAHKCGFSNEHIFDTLTHESAYWIGFIMGDGCVTTNRSSEPNTLQLCVAEKDLEHLNKFSRFLGSTNKYSSSIGNYNSRCYKLSVRSVAVCHKLKEYGVTPRKSFTAKAADCLVNNRDFWRGMIDSDGGIEIPQNRTPVISLCGSYETMNQFSNFVRAISPSCRASVTKMHSIYRVRVNGTYASRLAHYLYDCDGPYLDRKKRLASRLTYS
jgi:hypothetical protein